MTLSEYRIQRSIGLITMAQAGEILHDPRTPRGVRRAIYRDSWDIDEQGNSIMFGGKPGKRFWGKDNQWYIGLKTCPLPFKGYGIE
mgnify:CR=1 FL=1